VAVIPGTAFGVADACALRLSYGALDAASVEHGVSRLARGLTRLARG
jgi:aspartate/methionine/tyrosine aminotransferase